MERNHEVALTKVGASQPKRSDRSNSRQAYTHISTVSSQSYLGRHREQAGPMPSRCRRCKLGATPDKALFRCKRCTRCYHSACHRPLPKDPSNWVCKTCSDPIETKKRQYYEKSALSPPSSSRPALRVSASAASFEERSRKATTTIMAHTQSSAHSSRPYVGERDGRIDVDSCPWPDCNTRINVKEEAMCPEHLGRLKGNGHPRAPAAPAPRGTSLPNVAATLSLDSKPNSKKTLERPTMRKTASFGFPRSDHQPTLDLKYGVSPFPPSKIKETSSSLSSNQKPVLTTVASTTTTASAPPQFPPAPPPAYSTPMSPASLKDMEPPKKRQKVSPVLLQSNESKLNGVNASADSLSAPYSPEKQPDKERRTSLKQGKPSAKEPVRKMAPMRPFRFADEPDNALAHPSINGNAATSKTSDSTEVAPRQNPQSRSVSKTLEQGGRIDRMEIDPPPSILTLTSRHETLEIFSTTHGAAPGLHQPKADYFSLERGPSTSNRDESSESPTLPSTETNNPTPNGISTPPRVKKPKKLVIATKAGRPPAKATRPVTPTDLDYFIYSQPGASTPPPGLEISGLNKPSSAVSQRPPKEEPIKDEQLALDIDPRIHYPQPHSIAWHAMKAQEIEARGTRKQRFGKAAQSLRKQMEAQAELNIPWEETLPDVVQENPAWVRALKTLKGIPPTPAVEAESSGDPMDLTMNEGNTKVVSGSGVNGTVVNGAERKVRKMKRTGSGLSVMSRDGVLSFGDRNGQGSGQGSGGLNGSFGVNEYGMN
ncbi:hypothetical protein QBC41DRAFT_315063 [Cercophora samala]|uniref:PHD-type domain-containing protein n=1 Tax=Cercophora samala TaxID=330535 RepID=A0AA40DE81_9PEZI|nr:hypothetical protein QBC41DRAFT_315063 [Cercophora samala]